MGDWLNGGYLGGDGEGGAAAMVMMMVRGGKDRYCV